MSELRTIKKYPNRRLYDTAISSYITLEDVKQLVLERAEFHVIDARTNSDITRGILLQIISEQEEQGNPIFTAEVLAHIIRFYGANQDITVRKAAELKLQENQERLAEANRVSKLYPWEFDVATQMFTFTPEYYELLGTSVEENGGLQILAQDYATKFVPPDEAAIVANEVGKALATDDPNFSRNFESINLTTDGKTIPVRVRFRVVKDAQGNTIKTLGANQDITEQKAAEASLRRLKRELSSKFGNKSR